MSSIPDERSVVELPFINQLRLMNWQHTEGDVDVPELTERSSFRQVILPKRLRQAIRNINLDDEGGPWLDDSRVEQAAIQLERINRSKLIEANQEATEMLLLGTTVEGDPERHGGREQAVRYIDFAHPERNDFLAVNQFRVDRPADQGYIVPDIVLFVNGIPLVVVECKSPASTNPMEEGITQLLRYSNQRDWVEADEGVERLFYCNQLLISTFWYQARVGSITADYQHFLEWKDTSPIPMSRVAAELGLGEKDVPQSQQILVAGMLRPSHLLDIVRNFTLFHQISGRMAKIIPRYQQFRAVHAAIHRLQTGKTRLEDGKTDRRGGVVWHTQGSGKSLTMVFLVRKMRTIADLRSFKIVFVTDRIQLEGQLRETAALTGQTVRPDKDRDRIPAEPATEQMQRILREDGPDLVFAMVQKYQDTDDEGEVLEYRDREGRVQRQRIRKDEFPILNESERILVIVDEAHRSHTSLLHANLLRALPNCAKIGFTGTPIFTGDRKYTHDIFGDFIDRYTLQQSEADGCTVPILYEGRTADAAVFNDQTLDQLFEDMFRERTAQELEAIKRKYATAGAVLEAEKLIAAKADDILRHYVANILPNGFKAQLVAVSRLAAVRYQAALSKAHRSLVAELEALDSRLLALSEEKLRERGPKEKFLVRARQHLDTISRLEFATVISGSVNDDPAWRRWTEKSQQANYVSRFLTPLVHHDPSKRDGLAFLCVKSMLITGFDAPLEQVMYLDQPMRGHDLLQAIARVNRTASGKTNGLIADYCGVGRHLNEALAAYSREDVAGVLVDLDEELPKLADRHRAVLAVFLSSGVTAITDIDACVELLRDLKIRAEFVTKLKRFLETLDTVMPRPQAIPYLRDARILGFINKAASNRYRDPELSLVGAGRKVRQLIDEYVISRGIDPKVPPISITDAEFERAVDACSTDRAKASEMEHASRYHISVHFNEDPAYYKTLSQRLEEILEKFKENWTELVRALREFTREVQSGRPADESGLDPRTQAPFLGILLEEASSKEPVPKEKADRLAALTVEMVEHIRQEIGVVDFWRNFQAQRVLRASLREMLDRDDLFPLARQEAIADRLVELAKHLHTRLIG